MGRVAARQLVKAALVKLLLVGRTTATAKGASPVIQVVKTLLSIRKTRAVLGKKKQLANGKVSKIVPLFFLVSEIQLRSGFVNLGWSFWSIFFYLKWRCIFYQFQDWLEYSSHEQFSFPNLQKLWSCRNCSWSIGTLFVEKTTWTDKTKELLDVKERERPPRRGGANPNSTVRPRPENNIPPRRVRENQRREHRRHYEEDGEGPAPAGEEKGPGSRGKNTCHLSYRCLYNWKEPVESRKPCCLWGSSSIWPILSFCLG